VTTYYLDYNATTPVDLRVQEKLAICYLDNFGNPASREHSFGWDAADAVENARDQVADLINARGQEIVFTGSATESINCILKGHRRHRAHHQVSTFVTWQSEHQAVLEVCCQLSRGEAEIVRLPVNTHGQINLDELSHRLKTCPVSLVALMAANNETGNVYPLRETARIVHEAGALFFSDLTQATGKIPIDVRADGIDLAAFSAHKMCGPKGIGALFIRSGEPRIDLEPLIAGGGQERGLRGGTLNVPGIVGFGEACRIAQLEMWEEAERVRNLRDRLENALQAAFPDIWINGLGADRLPNTSNIGFSGVDARTLIRDMHDVAVSTRSACSSGDSGPSHVLKAMGLSDEQAYSSIRFSLGRFTTAEDIDYVIERVVSSVRKLRNRHIRTG
jgi:cysteine desulfurase